MSFTAFLLKLVGKHPEQLEEQERFDENMRELDKCRGALDSLEEGIEDVRRTVQDKSDALHETVTSLRPEGNEREETEESGVTSVSIDDPLPG